MGVNKYRQSETTAKDCKGFKKLFAPRRSKKCREERQEEEEPADCGYRGMANRAVGPQRCEPRGDSAEQQQQQGGSTWQAVRADGFHEEASSGRPRVRFGAAAAPSERYEPLVTDEEREEKKRRKKEKHKKYRKNVGRALRRGWTYFFAGVTSASNFYVSPWTVAAAMKRST